MYIWQNTCTVYNIYNIERQGLLLNTSKTMDISDNNTYVKSDILLCHYLQCVGSRKISDRYGEE